MDNLATLASMGFDIEECEIVLQEKNITIQEAIQRLLEKKVAKTKLTESKSENTTNQASTSRCQASGMDERNTGENVVSRFAISERQKVLKDEFEKKLQKDAQICAKRRKLQDRNAKELVLKEIEANKRHLQELRYKPSINNPSVPTSCEQESESVADLHPVSKCRIQVRLPTGKVINREFSAEDTLSAVMEVVMEHIANEVDESERQILMQPFPRKEFTADDLRKSLKDLGLCPNSSLVFVTKKNLEQLGSSSVNFKADKDDHIYSGGCKSNIHSVHSTGSKSDNPHSWGDGVSLGSTSQSQGTEASCDKEKDRSEIKDLSGSAFLNAVLLNSTNERGASTATGSSFDHDSISSPLNHTNDAAAQKIALIEAVEKRACSSARANEPLKRAIPSLERTISPLAHLSADVIAKCLAAQNGPVLSAVGKSLSQKAACQVIHALKTRKLLTGKLLNLLHQCKLSQLNLNFYTLASNEILEAARLHSTLTLLCLSQCSLITDYGVITAVRGLKSLQVLDLSGCVQVTDRSLLEIQELLQLRTLKLDNTKVKDDGLLPFLCHLNRSSLLELSLNSTKVTERGFPSSDEGFSLNLSSLYLDRSAVQYLKFLSSCKQLRHLSLSGTCIQRDSFHNIKQLQNLNELHLNYTKIQDHDLQHLQGMEIRVLGLPDRLTTSDVGLKYIQGLPLKELDLSDYIQITDLGLISVGKIESLTSLCLANTKITNQGLRHLLNLRKLQELDVSKTQIGDEGVEFITALRSIQTLSLASTRITDVCFKNGSLNRFDNLFKLNVSRNKVSESGIQNLQLPCLEMINADQTYTDLANLDILQGCPSLKVFRAKSCRPKTELLNAN